MCPPGRVWCRGHLVLSLLSLASVAQAQAALSSGLDCSGPVLDPITERCCEAQDAWHSVAEAGGCGGSGASEEQCVAAETLCQQCRGAAKAYQETATQASVEGVSLDSMSVGSLQMHCEMPQWNAGCSALTEIGLGALILAGSMLMLVAMGGLLLFDWLILPGMVSSHRRVLLSQAAGGKTSGCTASFPTPPDRVPSAPPTPTGKHPLPAAGRALDTLRFAASASNEPQDKTSDEEHGLQDISLPTSPSGARKDATLQVTSAALEPPTAAAKWPRRLASAWALRRAFLLISVVSVILRVAYAVACLIVLPTSSRQEIQDVLPEILIVVWSLLWCAWYSCPSDTTFGVPHSVAYWGPCQRFPRFSSYAAVTICMELYSTGVAAMAVAVTPCDAAPWKGVLLYCLGVLVAVSRAYSAVIALRLQDELAAACRKILPFHKEPEGQAPGLTTGDIQFGLDCGEGVGIDFEAELSFPQPVQTESQVAQEEQKSSLRWIWSFVNAGDVVVDKVHDINDPVAPVLACSVLPASCCPVLRKRLAGKRLLLWGGIALFLLSAVVSALVVRSAVGEEPQAAPQKSSCGVAQNATSTCLDYKFVGQHLTAESGEMSMDAANSMEDCCQGCDALQECQAWIYERVGKRCRWIEFVDEVCHENPGDLRCRCTSHSATVFGFKAKSKDVVWLRSLD